MLSPLDDLPIHRDAVELHAPGMPPTSFERYEIFVLRDERSVIALRMTVHPGRGIVDGAFAVLLDGRQRSLFASCRRETSDRRLHAGPLTLEVTEPLRRLSFEAFAPELGLAGAVSFTARRDAVAASSVDETRFVQWGDALVTAHVDGEMVADGTILPAVRRRSWGVSAPLAALADRERAPDHVLPQFFRYEITGDIDGQEILCAADEAPDGWRRRELAATDGAEAHHQFRPTWLPGTRWCAGGSLEVTGRDGTTMAGTLRTTARFPLRGLGVHHPSWEEGRWHDDLAVGTESVRVDELDPSSVHDLRMLHLASVHTSTGRTGRALVDLVAVGPHAPSGLAGFTDPPADPRPPANPALPL